MKARPPGSQNSEVELYRQTHEARAQQLRRLPPFLDSRRRRVVNGVEVVFVEP